MKEKSIDSGPDGFLILLLPLAFIIDFLFAAWPLLLGILAFSIGVKLWRRHEWQQWIEQVNPIFHQLIQANQGRKSSLELAMKANYTASAAKRYLDYKAEEFGAQRQTYEDAGTVYYFVTSSTLGSMFDKSEPASELEQQDEETADESKNDESLRLKDESSSSVAAIEPESQSLTHNGTHSPFLVAETAETTVVHAEPQQNHIVSLPQSLIQAELAKRLNVYSSTVYKRRDDPNFSEWSRSRDPDGIAWRYKPETKEFTPVEAEVSSKEVGSR